MRPFPRLKLLGAVAGVLLIGLSAQAQDFPPTIVNGACWNGSGISEGPIGTDLTKPQIRFRCDTAVIALGVGAEGRVLIQFTEMRSKVADIMAFAGKMLPRYMVDVDTVYLGGRQMRVTEGMCRLFFAKNGSARGVTCGAKIDHEGRRTVAVAALQVAAAQ